MNILFDNQSKPMIQPPDWIQKMNHFPVFYAADNLDAEKWVK